MASTSATHPIQKWIYDVFLSFRSQDTHKNFVTHLQNQLQLKGIHTFIENERPSLLQTIERSRFAIVVFSRNYASSMQCLDEVAAILECKEKLNQIVVPIFYDVHPIQVRKQTGSFAESFAKHEMDFEGDMEKVEKWRKALTEASNIAGHDLQNMYNGYEESCIQGVVDDILTQLRRASLVLQEKLVGLDSRVHEIGTMLSLESYDARFRVLTTTRDMGLLRFHKVDEEYEVHKLVVQEATQLFSWHAFHKEIPKKGFEELSQSIISHTTGLPLVLKVLGSFLYGLELREWRSTLEKLEDIPTDDIFAQLKISFDGLDCRGKKIFLDIACFFIKKKEDYVIDALKSCDLEPVTNIRILIEKSLLLILNGKIEMHDLIRDMGWHIASQENPRSRVWQFEDVDAVLSGNMEANMLEGLLIPAKFQHSYNENIRSSAEAFKRMKQLKILIVESYNFDSFRRMSRLKLLESFGTTIIGNYLPSSLRWLDFSYYHLHSLPQSFQPLELVALHLPHSSIQHWRIAKSLNKVTHLDLRSCSFLVGTPNLEWLPNLERLNLSDCVSLKEVHPSLGHLKKLVSLNLGRCISLEKLPSFVEMASLEYLDLDSCQKLETFPEIHNNMPRFRVLELQSVGTKKLPSSIEHLSGLTKIRIVGCENIECLPSSLCELRNLRVVELESCPKLEVLPENLGDLHQLQKLHVKNTAILQIPSSVLLLSELEYLYIGHSDGMSLFTTSPSFSLPSVSGLCSLKRLELSFLGILDEGFPRDLESLTSLEYLNLRGNDFIHLPESISQLPRLQYLDLKYCQKLDELPELPATVKELSLDTHLAYKTDIAALSTKYRELYSVSFTDLKFFLYFRRLQTPQLPDEFIPFSRRLISREDPFSVVYLTTMGSGYRISSKWFDCEKKGSSNISVNLNPLWCSDNFVGFAIYCLLPSKCGVWESREGDLFEHCAVTAKLVHGEDEKLGLQRKCVIGKSVENTRERDRARMCFTYVPLCCLWPESKTAEGLSPNDYSVFEASLDSEIATDWRFRLLYKDDEVLNEERDGAEQSSSITDANAISKGKRSFLHCPVRMPHHSRD